MIAKNVLKYLKTNYVPHTWINHYLWDTTSDKFVTKEAFRYTIERGDRTYWYDFILWDNEICIEISSQCHAMWGMYGRPYRLFVGEIKTVRDLKTLERILKIKE